MHNNPICIETYESIYNLIYIHKMLIICQPYTVNQTDCHMDSKKQLYNISFLSLYLFLSLPNT